MSVEVIWTWQVLENKKINENELGGLNVSTGACGLFVVTLDVRDVFFSSRQITLVLFKGLHWDHIISGPLLFSLVSFCRLCTHNMCKVCVLIFVSFSTNGATTKKKAPVFFFFLFSSLKSQSPSQSIYFFKFRGFMLLFLDAKKLVV